MCADDPLKVTPQKSRRRRRDRIFSWDSSKLKKKLIERELSHKFTTKANVNPGNFLSRSLSKARETNRHHLVTLEMNISIWFRSFHVWSSSLFFIISTRKQKMTRWGLPCMRRIKIIFADQIDEITFFSALERDHLAERAREVSGICLWFCRFEHKNLKKKFSYWIAVLSFYFFWN